MILKEYLPGWDAKHFESSNYLDGFLFALEGCLMPVRFAKGYWAAEMEFFVQITY